MKKKLRLLLFEKCPRNCEGCCNKQFDLSTLPVCTDYTGYDEIILTGGEPMLDYELVLRVIADIRKMTDAPIYLYTAKVDNIEETLAVLNALDGICITLHEPDDVWDFAWLDFCLPEEWVTTKSLRLNIFREVGLTAPWESWKVWKVKADIEWIIDLALPTGEVLMRLDNSPKDGILD